VADDIGVVRVVDVVGEGEGVADGVPLLAEIDGGIGGGVLSDRERLFRGGRRGAEVRRGEPSDEEREREGDDDQSG
jgi:hypothetical protein